MIVYQYNEASIEHPERCEDAILVFPGGDDKAPLFVVVDGMGGHQHQSANGELVTGRDAAQLIRNVLIEDLEHLPPDIDASPGGLAEQRIMAALTHANERVLAELNSIEGLASRHRVGAVLTVTVVCENGKRVLVMQVGDTRGYLYSEGELIQLCADEDNIEYFVRERGLSEDDAARLSTVLNEYDGVHEPKAEGTIMLGGQKFDLYMAWRWFLVGNPALNIPAANIVLNALGINENKPVPEMSRIEIAPGDVLFLCSDGLYKNLSDTEIATGLETTSASDDTAQKLGGEAFARSQDTTNHRSYFDDISAVVVKFE
ncbi:MAG: protein phosphatase 2C domain-containing protein [Chloroflexota bacterium]